MIFLCGFTESPLIAGIAVAHGIPYIVTSESLKAVEMRFKVAVLEKIIIISCTQQKNRFPLVLPVARVFRPWFNVVIS
jgi:hypothetical protein